MIDADGFWTSVASSFADDINVCDIGTTFVSASAIERNRTVRGDGIEGFIEMARATDGG
jgi:hypothetical protein